MGSSLDLKFSERSEAIVTQLGFKDLRSFVKNQALFMLMAKIEKYEAENKRFEAKNGKTGSDPNLFQFICQFIFHSSYVRFNEVRHLILEDVKKKR